MVASVDRGNARRLAEGTSKAGLAAVGAAARNAARPALAHAAAAVGGSDAALARAAARVADQVRLSACAGVLKEVAAAFGFGLHVDTRSPEEAAAEAAAAAASRQQPEQQSEQQGGGDSKEQVVQQAPRPLSPLWARLGDACQMAEAEEAAEAAEAAEAQTVLDDERLRRCAGPLAFSPSCLVAQAPDEPLSCLRFSLCRRGAALPAGTIRMAAAALGAVLGSQHKPAPDAALRRKVAPASAAQVASIVSRARRATAGGLHGEGAAAARAACSDSAAAAMGAEHPGAQEQLAGPGSQAGAAEEGKPELHNEEGEEEEEYEYIEEGEDPAVAQAAVEGEEEAAAAEPATLQWQQQAAPSGGNTKRKVVSSDGSDDGATERRRQRAARGGLFGAALAGIRR